jgi:hypothetical protein
MGWVGRFLVRYPLLKQLLHMGRDEKFSDIKQLRTLAREEVSKVSCNYSSEVMRENRWNRNFLEDQKSIEDQGESSDSAEYQLEPEKTIQ